MAAGVVVVGVGVVVVVGLGVVVVVGLGVVVVVGTGVVVVVNSSVLSVMGLSVLFSAKSVVALSEVSSLDESLSELLSSLSEELLSLLSCTPETTEESGLSCIIMVVQAEREDIREAHIRKVNISLNFLFIPIFLCYKNIS